MYGAILWMNHTVTRLFLRIAASYSQWFYEYDRVVSLCYYDVQLYDIFVAVLHQFYILNTGPRGKISPMQLNNDIKFEKS